PRTTTVRTPRFGRRATPSRCGGAPSRVTSEVRDEERLDVNWVNGLFGERARLRIDHEAGDRFGLLIANQDARAIGYEVEVARDLSVGAFLLKERQLAVGADGVSDEGAVGASGAIGVVEELTVRVDVNVGGATRGAFVGSRRDGLDLGEFALAGVVAERDDG